MAVEVKIPSLLQQMVGGAKSLKVKGNTVGQVLENLECLYPGFKEKIISEDGKLRPFINIFVNEEDIYFLNGLDTAVKEGDVLWILPAMVGGTKVQLDLD